MTDKETKRAGFVSFSTDTAGKTGSSRRYIEQTVQIANNIPSELKKMIRKSDLADNKKELLQLARLDNKLQHKVVKLRLKQDDMLIWSRLQGVGMVVGIVGCWGRWWGWWRWRIGRY